MRVRRAVLAGIAVAGATLAFPTGTFAAKPSPADNVYLSSLRLANLATTGSTGHDISWPQCPSDFPSSGSFGIVGVTDGLPWSTNPCLPAEYGWAASLAQAPMLYMNTANPGPTSQHWNLGGPKPCLKPRSRFDKGCAYDYGWNSAADAYQRALGVTPAPNQLGWWLDVETGNSWVGSHAANTADIQGSIDYLKSRSVPSVGIYSTRYQWTQITGGASSPAPNWVAGASSEPQAVAMCSATYSFSGGAVALTQYPDAGWDGDYSCA